MSEAVVVRGLGKEFSKADLETLSERDLVSLMDDLNAQREGIKNQGVLVKEVLTKRIQGEAIITKLAGLSEIELGAVLAAAKSDPAALTAAIEKSRKARPVLEVQANTSTVGVIGQSG